MDLSSTNNIDNISEDFFSMDKIENKLEEFCDKVSTVENQQELENCIVKNFTDFINLFISHSDIAQKELAEITPKTNILYYYFINYIISEDVKNLIIVLRNVHIELSKADIFEIENQTNNTKTGEYLSETKLFLTETINAFSKRISSHKLRLYNTRKYKQVIHNKIRLYQNPWNVYKNQFLELINQFESISESNNRLREVSNNFESISNITDVIKKGNNSLYTSLIINVDEILNLINSGNTDSLISFIDKQHQQELKTVNNLDSFSEDISNRISLLGTVKVPINSNRGIINIREIDLNKSVTKWFDYQIFPDFVDLINLEEEIKNKYQFSLLNLKNRIKLVKSLEEIEHIENITASLSRLKSEINEIKIKSREITDSIYKNLKDELLASNLYKSRPFLSIPIQATINFRRSPAFNRIKNIYLDLKSQYLDKLGPEIIDEYSKAESSANCIAHRMDRKSGEHYDMLFLSRFFIGDLFLVPRAIQEHQFNKEYNRWKNNFHSSVIVTGDRLSGKSTFLKYVSNKYFKKNIVDLKPNKTATIDGRKFSTTYDLKEALEYVKNNNKKSTRPILIIDDPELWHDSEHSFSENIRALLKFVESESENIFIVIGSTGAMIEKLNDRFGLKKIFTQIIDLNKSNSDEITKAIFLRHGTLHKELVSEELKIISDRVKQQIIKKLAVKNNWNIGLTLRAWAYSTNNMENNKVVYSKDKTRFINYFSKDELIILKQTLLYKRISELSLKNVTADKFETKFNPALKRMINNKVLQRNKAGKLEINPVILNEIQYILRDNKLIH